MRASLWWAVVLPNTGVVGQLYVTKGAADMSWGNVDGAKFIQVKLVPVKTKKKTNRKS
jgi:hypothetical protein